MAADGKIEALRSVSLFSDLRQRDLEQVAQLADEVDLPAGHVLMREGETGSQMFVMSTGEAAVRSPAWDRARSSARSRWSRRDLERRRPP